MRRIIFLLLLAAVVHTYGKHVVTNDGNSLHRIKRTSALENVNATKLTEGIPNQQARNVGETQHDIGKHLRNILLLKTEAKKATANANDKGNHTKQTNGKDNDNSTAAKTNGGPKNDANSIQIRQADFVGLNDPYDGEQVLKKPTVFVSSGDTENDGRVMANTEFDEDLINTIQNLLMTAHDREAIGDYEDKHGGPHHIKKQPHTPQAQMKYSRLNKSNNKHVPIPYNPHKASVHSTVITPFRPSIRKSSAINHELSSSILNGHEKSDNGNVKLEKLYNHKLNKVQPKCNICGKPHHHTTDHKNHIHEHHSGQDHPPIPVDTITTKSLGPLANMFRFANLLLYGLEENSPEQRSANGPRYVVKDNGLKVTANAHNSPAPDIFGSTASADIHKNFGTRSGTSTIGLETFKPRVHGSSASNPTFKSARVVLASPAEPIQLFDIIDQPIEVFLADDGMEIIEDGMSPHCATEHGDKTADFGNEISNDNGMGNEKNDVIQVCTCHLFKKKN